jgi:hypothetical protein
LKNEVNALVEACHSASYDEAASLETRAIVKVHLDCTRNCYGELSCVYFYDGVA